MSAPVPDATFPPPRPLPAQRAEVVGDGLSAAALITSWVGATVPLLPGVALLVAIAGRRRSATRWLNTVAVVVSAVLLTAQVVAVVAFGGLLVTALQQIGDRAGTSTTTDDGMPGRYEDYLGEESMAPATPGQAPVDPEGAANMQNIVPGTDEVVDGVFLDTLGSALEESGVGAEEYPDKTWFTAAGASCSALDGGASLDESITAGADAAQLPEAGAAGATSAGVVTYCPQHTGLLS